MTTPVEKFKLDFLFKKTLGTPAALGTSYSSAAEAAGSSKSKIIKNLVINQEIPSAAPSTDLTTATINSTYIPTGNTSDTKQISTTYPYIAKYTLTLKAASIGFSYYYNDPAAGKNLLDSVIPFNFDPKGTYSYDVKLDGTTVPGAGINTAGEKSWILDTDSGYLYFPNSDAGSSAITITFWRYEGTYGVGSSNGGSSSGAVTGDLSSNGNLFIAFDASLNSRLVVGSDVTINKRLFTVGDASLNGNLYVAGDTSFNGNVTIGKDLTINGRLNVQNYTNQNIINTTTTNYQLIVSEDLSLNGRLFASGTISGNIVNTSSTTSTTNDTWLLTNILNAPPGVTFGNVVSTSTYIYIPWTYPSQTNIGLVSTYVPVISAINANVYGNTSGGRFSTNVLTNITGNQYINNYSISSNPNTYTSVNNTPITGIILSKSSAAGTSGSTTLTPNTVCQVPFPQDNGNSYTGTNYRNAFVYYNSNISSLIASPNPTFTLYYTNNKSTYNSSLVNFSIFLSTGTPSAPGTPSQTANSSSGITISYTAPQYGDSNNQTIVTPITNYKITYQSTANTVRYGGVGDSSGNTLTGSNSTSYAITGLYPDTSYTIFVQARNGDNASYGNVSANLTTAVTSYISPSITGITNNLSFSPTSYSAKLVSTSSSISNLILSNSALTSSTNTFAVHELSNRGNLGNATPVSLRLDVSGAASITGPSVAINNYPSTNTTSSTSNGLYINTITVSDSYSATGSTGFYLQGNGTVTLGTSIFTPSNSQYTVTLTRTGATTQSKTYSFYYDTTGATPVIGGVTINKLNTTANSTTRQVSGVWVVYGSPTLDVSCTDVSNVGHYFYNNSQLLSYSSTTSGTISASETTLTNVASGITAGVITGNLTITKSALSYNTNSTFHTAIGVKATAYNIQETSANRDATSIAAIVDPASQTLVYSTLQQSIGGSNLSSATSGYRIYSGVCSGSNGYRPDSLYSYNSTTYVNTAYDNAWDITSTNNSGSLNATNELQVANGYFQTITGTSNGYKNYTSYYYGTSLNTVIYSGISSSGYRYATFAWRLTSISNTNGYSGITFTLVNSSSTTYDAGTTTAYVTGTTKKIQLYYRIETSNAPTPTTTSANKSTAWIDGNFAPASLVNSNNFNSEGSAGLSSFLYNGSSTFNVILPYAIYNDNLTSNPFYIYCRVGLPMDVAYQFNYITANMT